MTTPEQLLLEVRDAEQAGEPEAIDAAREAYLEVASPCAEATEIRYKHGLARLFRDRDVDGAITLFKEAAQDKGSPFGQEARISYALCLLQKNKRQQAIFELRKLLPQGAPPSFHTVQALDFMAMLLRESGAAPAELSKVDQQRLTHLSELATAAKETSEQAHLRLRLAAAHLDLGTASDIERARAELNVVLKLGVAAGEASLEAAREALKTLPR
ncbi:MAG: tetratricopeptide repeat protein [Myxococcota bacterium]